MRGLYFVVVIWFILQGGLIDGSWNLLLLNLFFAERQSYAHI